MARPQSKIASSISHFACLYRTMSQPKEQEMSTGSSAAKIDTDYSRGSESFHGGYRRSRLPSPPTSHVEGLASDGRLRS